jgi:hypothetical protein
MYVVQVPNALRKSGTAIPKLKSFSKIAKTAKVSFYVKMSLFFLKQ